MAEGAGTIKKICLVELWTHRQESYTNFMQYLKKIPRISFSTSAYNKKPYNQPSLQISDAKIALTVFPLSA